MKKRLTIMMSYDFEVDEEYDNIDDLKTFDDFRNCDYDNVDRPITHMEDVGWEIITTHIE